MTMINGICGTRCDTVFHMTMINDICGTWCDPTFHLTMINGICGTWCDTVLHMTMIIGICGTQCHIMQKCNFNSYINIYIVKKLVCHFNLDNIQSRDKVMSLKSTLLTQFMGTPVPFFSVKWTNVKPATC